MSWAHLELGLDSAELGSDSAELTWNSPKLTLNSHGFVVVATITHRSRQIHHVYAKNAKDGDYYERLSAGARGATTPYHSMSKIISVRSSCALFFCGEIDLRHVKRGERFSEKRSSHRRGNGSRGRSR